MKLIDPINAVITFNVGIREDEGMPIEGLTPVQITVPAAQFRVSLDDLVRSALVEHLGAEAANFRMLGDTLPEDLPSPEPLELPEEKKEEKPDAS